MSDKEPELDDFSDYIDKRVHQWFREGRLTAVDICHFKDGHTKAYFHACTKIERLLQEDRFLLQRENKRGISGAYSDLSGAREDEAFLRKSRHFLGAENRGYRFGCSVGRYGCSIIVCIIALLIFFIIKGC